MPDPSGDRKENGLIRFIKDFALLIMNGHRTHHILPLEEWQQFRARVFWCYEGGIPADALRSRQRTSNYSGWLLLDGTARVKIGGRIWTAKRGQWIIVPPGESERWFSENIRLLSIHFQFQWSSGRPLFSLMEPIHFSNIVHPQVEKTVRRIGLFFQKAAPQERWMFWKEPLSLRQYLRLEAMTGAFADALSTALEGEGILPDPFETHDPKIEAALAYLRALPLDRPFRMREAAKVLGISPVHLARIFRCEFGQTPRKHFELRRFEHARNALAAGGASVKEVAGSVGLGAAEFSRWFGRLSGHAPKNYRAQSIWQTL